MSNLKNLQGKALVEAMTLSEINVVHAASRIFQRVFGVTSISGRLNTKLSDTTVYTVVHKLNAAGILQIHNLPVINSINCGRSQKDIVLEISMTPKGRSICSIIKQLIEEQELAESNMQPALL